MTNKTHDLEELSKEELIKKVEGLREWIEELKEFIHVDEECPFCWGKGEYPKADGQDDMEMVACQCQQGCGYDEIDNTVEK